MKLMIIGAPYDLDRPNTGMGKAPAALLDAGLAQRLELAGVETIVAGLLDIPDSDAPREERLGALLARLGHEVARARAAGFFPLVLGGDCMTAIGTVAGLLDPSETGIVWVDAHGDFNTPETSTSGYLGGMPLACIVGRGLEDLRRRGKLNAPVPERNVVLLNARDLDPQEAEALAGAEVTHLRAPDLGNRKAVAAALGELAVLTQVYLHVDIDALDPAEAPGVDYPAPDGLRLPELQALVRRVVGMGNLAALAITAVNPERDADGRTVAAALAVAEAAVSELVNLEL